MIRSKIEYFLNAVLYFLWFFHKRVGQYTDRLISLIPKYFFTDNFRKKYNENMIKEKPRLDEFYNNKKNGFYIGMADYWFDSFYYLYSCAISFIIAGCFIKRDGKIDGVTTSMIVFIIIGISAILPLKMIFIKDRYLKYFKEFEKEDEHWHKKWKRITIAFCIGGVITFLSGLGVAWIILLS